MVCRDFISWGYKPHLEVLDRLLSCLRLQLPKPPQRPTADLQQRAMQLQVQLQALPHPDAPGDLPSSSAQDSQQQPGQWLSTTALLRDLATQRRALSAEDRPYEVPFDKRAIDAVADAISMGILPGLKVGGCRVCVCVCGTTLLPAACLLGAGRCSQLLASQAQNSQLSSSQQGNPFCAVPTCPPCSPNPPGHPWLTLFCAVPTCLPALLRPRPLSHPQLDAPLTVDMRSFPPCVAEAYVHLLMSTIESRAAAAAGQGQRQPVTQRVRLIVPAFDHNYVMWPSYVEKLHVHYNEQLLARQVRVTHT